MARAIDSEAAYRFLSEQLVKETGAFSKGVNKGLNIAQSAMRNPDAIPALRPVSRERVEKVFPGCDYCKHAWMEGLDLKPCANRNIGVELTIGRASEEDAFGILAYYRNAAAGYIDFPFCPFCGAPMTDEAVDMVMERINKKEEPGNGLG